MSIRKNVCQLRVFDSFSDLFAIGSFCSTELTTKPVRILLSSFHVAESKSILVGFSFRLSSAHVGYPLARDLLLRAGSGNIDQSEDFIAMMHD